MTAVPRWEVFWLFLHLSVAVPSSDLWTGLLTELPLADSEANLCLLQRAASAKLNGSVQTNRTADALPRRRNSLMMLAAGAADELTSRLGKFRLHVPDLFTANALDAQTHKKSGTENTSQSAERDLLHDVLEHTKREKKKTKDSLDDEKEVEQEAKIALVKHWLTSRQILVQSVRATMLGVASGISMPIGVILQSVLFSISDEACSSLLAIGAGSLLFAVTIAIYGRMLRDHTDMWHKSATIAGGVFGALFFICMDRWLEHWLESGAESHDASSAACDSDGRSEPADLPILAPIPSNSEFDREVTPDISKPRPLTPQTALSPPCSTKRAPEEAVVPYATLPELLESESPRQRRKSTGSVWTGYSTKEPLNYTNAQEFFEGRQKRFSMVTIVAAELTENPEVKAARKVALTLFLGLLIDGVPEGIFMGFLAAEGKLSHVLVLSLLIANLPEALSSSLLLERAGMSFRTILSLWTGLCIFVGLLCGASCALMLCAYPEYAVGKQLPPTGGFVVALIEGISGGAMLACISAVMLPEALKRSGKDVPLWRSSGCLCVMGFLLSVGLEVISTSETEE